MLIALVAAGATVIALDIDADRLETARQFGAAHALDARASELTARLREILGGTPIDVAVEASGAPSGPPLAQQLIRRGGTLALVGIQKAPIALDLADLVVREVDVVTSQAHGCGEDLPEALELLAARHIAGAAIDRVVGLEDVVEGGFEPLARGEVSGKVLVSPGGAA